MGPKRRGKRMEGLTTLGGHRWIVLYRSLVLVFLGGRRLSNGLTQSHTWAQGTRQGVHKGHSMKQGCPSCVLSQRKGDERFVERPDKTKRPKRSGTLYGRCPSRIESCVAYCHLYRTLAHETSTRPAPSRTKLQRILFDSSDMAYAMFASRTRRTTLLFIPWFNTIRLNSLRENTEMYEATL